MKTTPQIQRRPQIQQGKYSPAKVSEFAESANLPAKTRLDTDDPLTYAVIGVAMQVHSELGPGLDELYYHELLSERLRANNLEHESKARATLLHRGLEADVFECDLLFLNGLVLELKTLAAPETFAPEHLAQLISYLKFWRIQTGLLLDFGKERLAYRRVIFRDTPVSHEEAINSITFESGSLRDDEMFGLACETIVRVVETHGFGYRDTSYTGLIAADFAVEKTPFTNQPSVAIQSAGKILGEMPCNCFMVGDTVALMVLALRSQINTTDRAILQTYLRHLDRQKGLIVNFGKNRLDLLSVTSPKSRKTHHL